MHYGLTKTKSISPYFKRRKRKPEEIELRFEQWQVGDSVRASQGAGGAHGLQVPMVTN